MRKPQPNPDKAPEPTSSGRPLARGVLPLESPQQAEDMARWVEGLYAPFHRLIANESSWASTHPDDADSRGRLLYYRHAIAISRQIAYYLRTFRVRGVGS